MHLDMPVVVAGEDRRPTPLRDATAARPGLRVGIVGFGTIGRRVAHYLADGTDGLTLEALSSRDAERTRLLAEDEGLGCDVVDIQALVERCDVVVDCAISSAFESILQPALLAGRTVVTVNGGALLDHLDLADIAAANGGRIILATGALLGLDAVRAAAIDTIHSVRLVTRKPPRAFINAPRVVELGLDLDSITEPVCLFQGTARAAARAFPANVNVAAALSLAGIGPDLTMVEVWADPALERNTHAIDVDADSTRFSMQIENIPSDDNPATGRVSALSVIATLQRLVLPLVLGP